jgi:3-deoxy-7-phosphoheptulonate synthase
MNTNVSEMKEVIVPVDLQIKHSMTVEDIEFVCKSRDDIQNILTKKDKRFLVIVGPCSIHDYDSAIQYAKELKKLIDSSKNLYIVMRVYFEKPRSRTGWKGFIYDPDLDNSYDINKGLTLARKLLLELVQMRIPVGCEFLDLITPQYISDLVSWGAIGARTSESQTHRQLASGLSMPIGFKNLTSGDTDKAINGIISAQVPHNFIGINEYGKVSHVITKGNAYSHLILRGGDEPNYDQNTVEKVTESLKREKIENGIIIDCSHGNSQSNYNRQIAVSIYVRRLFELNKYPISGIMLESNIEKGNQKLINKQDLKYGQSITDACIDINTTKALITLLDNLSAVKIGSLGEIRKLIREYDQIIYEQIINNSDLVCIKSDIVPCQYMFERDKVLEEITKIYPNAERLIMLITLRFGLSEKVAALKFYANPYNYLYKGNDFLKLITDREIEKSNLKLFNHNLYLKIMDNSKLIQVDYLEAFTKSVKIGYLFGVGTFSGEAVQKFRGDHIAYENYDTLKSALDAKKVDYILIPTYNSLIGEVLPAEAYWESFGTVDHNIELYLFSNRNIGTVKKIYLEPHIEKECAVFLEKYTYLNVISSKSSLEGCISCIKDSEPAWTISSKNNSSNFLNTVKKDIVEHNITTFSLFGL